MSKPRAVRFTAIRPLLDRLPAPLRRFAGSEQGVTAVEFALVLPVFLLIMLGCLEVPRFVMVYQKIARTSSGVADLVAQADEPITGNQVQDIFIAGATMMQPYDVINNGKIYVSSINNPTGTIELSWQRDNFGKMGSGSNLTNPATALPVTLRPAVGEEVLAAEVFFRYEPIFPTLIYEGSDLYMVSYTRPRNKNLKTPPSDPDCQVASKPKPSC